LTWKIVARSKGCPRILVRNMIRDIDFYETEVCVRVNNLGTPRAIDLEKLFPPAIAIRYPKPIRGGYCRLIRIIEISRTGMAFQTDDQSRYDETAMGAECIQYQQVSPH
jgi:hypothetical protein